MMRWHALGHAAWLAEVAGLRLLFDPALGPTHHGGVFEVIGRRGVALEALRPDFIFVSHAHTDHFDPATLLALARLDAESVVVTPDALVADASRKLGFRTVREVAPGARVELDGAMVVTSPSIGDGEWGVIVSSDGAVVWNQVDTRLPAGSEAAFWESASAALGRGLPAGLELVLARWAPLLEIAAVTGQRTGFPYRTYEQELASLASLGAHAIVPASAFASHVSPYDWLDAFVHPVSEARFLRDLALAAPATRGLPYSLGATYEVAAASVSVDPEGASSLVDARPALDPRAFHPTGVPHLIDHDDRPSAELRPRIDAWVSRDLAPALSRAFPAPRRALAFMLEVVYRDGARPTTIRVEAGRAPRVTEERDSEWDALVQITASALHDVLGARAHFGDVLLSGRMRGYTRAYDVALGGALERLPVGAIFLYHALPYDEAFRRWAAAEVDRLTAG